jgi:hypothetical protein
MRAEQITSTKDGESAKDDYKKADLNCHINDKLNQ